MGSDMFSKLSLSAQEQTRIQEDILQGKFGQPGEAFLTTRALAEARHVSVVTAHNILTGLSEAGYIALRGKRYYLTHGELMKARDAQTRVIGMIVPQFNNEFYSSLSDAVVEIARKNGFRLLLMSTGYSPAEERKAVRALIDQNVAGIINCLPTPHENDYLYINCPLPCVLLGHSLDKSHISSVQVNSFSISQKVAQNLTEEGYESFIYIGTNTLKPEDDIRFTAFQMELRRLGRELPAGNVFRLSASGSTPDEVLLSQRLKAIKEPVGVFCYHDLLAVRLYRLCGKLGKRIPEDVGVIGFDDLSVATSLYPPLTTVQYRIGTMADMAMNLLLARIKSPNSPYDNYYIEPNLVVRKSASLNERSTC